MTNFKKSLLLVAAVIAGFTAISEAHAATATFDANATVITPIAITRTAHLNFGSFAPTGSAGTVTVDEAGTRSQTNVLLSGGTVNAAAFDVTGQASTAYTVTLPATANVTSGANTMAVSFAAANVTGDTLNQTLNGLGAHTLAVGGEIAVGASQAAGTYTGSFTMTVNY